MSAPGAVSNVPSMAALELAEWSVEARANFMLFDLRAEGAEPRLLGSFQLPAASLLDLRRRPSLSKDRVLVVMDERDDGPAREVAASLMRAGLQAVCLSGGAAAFASEVLDPAVRDPRAAAYRVLLSGESPFGGAAPAAPAREKKAPPARKKKKSTGCS